MSEPSTMSRLTSTPTRPWASSASPAAARPPRPHPPAPHRAHQRRGDSSRAEICLQARRRGAPQGAARHADHLPGPLFEPQPPHDAWTPSSARPWSPRDRARRGAPRAGQGAPGPRRPPALVHQPLPARVLGRSAPAPGDRPRPGPQARVHRLRRGGVAPWTSRSRPRSSTSSPTSRTSSSSRTCSSPRPELGREAHLAACGRHVPGPDRRSPMDAIMIRNPNQKQAHRPAAIAVATFRVIGRRRIA
jgi:hypothetical protein